MIGNAAADESEDWLLQGISGLFVLALIGTSVAGAYMSIPAAYPEIRVGAAILALAGDVAAIRCYMNMHRHCRQGRKYKFLVNMVCWLLFGSITIGSSTLFLQWVFKVADKPHAVQQAKVAGAGEFLKEARNGVLTAKTKADQKTAAGAVKIAEASFSDALKGTAENVQHIAAGNEIWYVLFIYFVTHGLLYAASGDGKTEVPQIEASRYAKEILMTANAAPLPAPPPPGKRIAAPEQENPRKDVENLRISAENAGNVVEFTGKRKRKMPTAEEVLGYRATVNPETGKNYTYQEIADLFGCHEKTCRNRVTAARRQAVMKVA